ncbi:MAG: NAD-dependent epimerase/dehydratase family protein, partial [Myxococcota bacterium]|nr:NAD-dependent epimerase/dehydratase family protein [Myxococcota bacterium]
FVTRMLEGLPPVIFGDGHQSRDFTHVDNVVQANLACLDAPLSACGEVYNVGLGTNTSLLELVGHLNAIMGTEIEPIHRPERAGDVRHSCASIARARSHINYEPKTSIQNGLERTVAWFASGELDDASG